LKEHGLELEVSMSDAGTRLNAGILSYIGPYKAHSRFVEI